MELLRNYTLTMCTNEQGERACPATAFVGCLGYLKHGSDSRDENEQRTRRLPENAGSNRRRHLEQNWARSGVKKL